MDNARRKNVRKRAASDDADVRKNLATAEMSSLDVLTVHEVLDELAAIDREVFELVKLRFFAGFSLEEAATILGIPQRTAERRWAFARGWLYQRLDENFSKISGG